MCAYKNKSLITLVSCEIWRDISLAFGSSNISPYLTLTRVISLIYYYILYICKTFFYLSKYSLSEVYFNTDRLLSEFNGLWYSLAARQVFVAIAVVWVKDRNTNIAQAPNHTPTIADTKNG